MDRELNREKIVSRVKRALRSKKHQPRVYFNEKNQPFYRVGPGNTFVRVQALLKGNLFRVMKKTENLEGLSREKIKKIKKK